MAIAMHVILSGAKNLPATRTSWSKTRGKRICAEIHNQPATANHATLDALFIRHTEIHAYRFERIKSDTAARYGRSMIRVPNNGLRNRRAIQKKLLCEGSHCGYDTFPQKTREKWPGEAAFFVRTHLSHFGRFARRKRVQAYWMIRNHRGTPLREKSRTTNRRTNKGQR